MGEVLRTLDLLMEYADWTGERDFLGRPSMTVGTEELLEIDCKEFAGLLTTIRLEMGVAFSHA